MSHEDKWVDEIYRQMNDTQRIGQLIMIRAHSNLGAEHIGQVAYLIKNYYVGGLCFFQGTPEKQAELTNYYQKISQLPLLIAMDAEWGLNMRLKDACIAYPHQMMLGAIQDNSLIYRYGQTIANELKRVGVHINFAPVADVSSNPQNPVINDRSFGEDKFNVATKSYMYMKGMQDNGILACAKHFPGHGDTDKDSHYRLPLITHSMSRLNALELLPFRVLSQHGISSLMVGHLQVPSIENEASTPVSISKNAVRSLLREQIGFEGVIFTDALEMKAYTRINNNGEGEAKAIAAGNDMLCLPESTPAAFNAIKRYIAEGKIDTLELEKSVKRILRAKYQLGLSVTPPEIVLNNLRQELNSSENIAFKRELIQNALTLVKNDDNLVPFKTFVPDSIATLSLGSSSLTPFQYHLNSFGLFNQFNLTKYITPAKKQEMLAYFSKKKTVIVGIHEMKTNPAANFGISQDVKNFIADLNKVTKVVLVVFGNPYALRNFDDVKTVVACYNEDKMTQEAAAQGLFGAFEFKGKLPVSASDDYKCGMGYNTLKNNRLQWNLDMPEAVGFNKTKLEKIDDIAHELIAAKAAPGCQILVAKEGQVVYHKAFGHHTYDKTQATTLNDIYDLASITKCAATTICAMKLYEEGKLDLNATLGKYLPQLRGSNKENLVIRDVLTHQAGLIAWIPFYKNTLEVVYDKERRRIAPSSKWFSTIQTSEYNIEVANRLYMRNDYVDSIKSQIIKSPLHETRRYVYSDLGMMLMKEVIESLIGETLDTYVEKTFYTPLSMKRTAFNPLKKFAEEDIVPTEEDDYFRNQRLRGYVHDMASAMQGGVSGHAGLFSTTSDLATLLQMLLNGGEYDDIRYFQPETIELFTNRQCGSSRRGYGWDMKELNNARAHNMSPLAPASTFGHTGFTGNAMFTDPDNQLIYIFLSNRTYPDMNNNKLIKGDYRARIQSVIYEALERK